MAEELNLGNLLSDPMSWTVTGAAGFIGSHLVETLLRHGQQVTGIDNFSTGKKENLDSIRKALPPEAWSRFRFIEGDIRKDQDLDDAFSGSQFVLHQAALGSVTRSIERPADTFDNNVMGTLRVFMAAKRASIKRVVYASSSSVYGDHPDLPKFEDKIGRCLSPYALSKAVAEQLGDLYSRTLGLEAVGLRYFNVFGPRQNPEGPYAAVIPLWFKTLAQGQAPFINGDGKTSRDFCYVANAVQANIRGALTTHAEAVGKVFNVSCGDRTDLNLLFELIRDLVAAKQPAAANLKPQYRDFRPGDVRHSMADISLAKRLLGYEPKYDINSGLNGAASWYLSGDKNCK